MYLIGLTGGIASGKSAVAERLANHGAIVVDADVLARRVVEPGTPGLARIAQEFGPGVISSDGSLDRAALGEIVFSDPDKRLVLNAITHPEIQRLSEAIFAEASAADPYAVGVYDVPLLVEAAHDEPRHYDLVVVVHADAETRIRRMMQLRGMTRHEASHRINSQASDAERLAIADVVIDSNGTLEWTLEQADELWEMAAASAHSALPD
ncbi:MAG: dephospho-CoA kinase, long form [Salinibacterium sp.]|nr:dephospho-CoA kinase, long form [Salinibacterium sp.]